MRGGPINQALGRAKFPKMTSPRNTTTTLSKVRWRLDTRDSLFRCRISFVNGFDYFLTALFCIGFQVCLNPSYFRGQLVVLDSFLHPSGIIGMLKVVQPCLIVDALRDLVEHHQIMSAEVELVRRPSEE